MSLGETPSRRDRWWRGLLFGAGWLFPGMGWMWFLTAPGYLVAGLLFAALHGLAVVIAPTGPWRVIGRPAAHTVVEAFAARDALRRRAARHDRALGQAGRALLGVAAWAAVLLTWLVFQIGFALAGPSPYVPAMVRRRGARPHLHGGAAFLAAVVVIVLAAVAPEGADAGRTMRVTIVQGGGPQGTCAIPHRPARRLAQRHLAATSSIEPGSTDLVVWPENVIDVETFDGSVEHQEIAAQAKRIGAPFAVGITEEVARTSPDDPGAVP